VNIGDTYYAQAGQTLTIDLVIKNNGSQSMNLNNLIIEISCPLSSPPVVGDFPASLVLPPDGSCITIENIIQFTISSSASGVRCQIYEMYYSGSAPSGYSCDSSIFIMTIEVQ
jgi:hypothetical protein